MENSSMIQEVENLDLASSRAILQNDARTGEKIDTPLTQPRSPFGLHHARRDLIAKRNAEADPIRRGQISVLIEQLTNYDRATGMQRIALASAIKAQLNRMAQIQG